jgi:CheY-like chemotaxis protein
MDAQKRVRASFDQSAFTRVFGSQKRVHARLAELLARNSTPWLSSWMTAGFSIMESPLSGSARRVRCRQRDGAVMSSNLRDVVRRTAAQASSSRSVLVVEDDFFLRSAVVDVLGRHGFTVFEARDTDMACEVLKSKAIDLLFTDIKLPGFVDGLALATLVRKTWPRLKIVIASGHIPAGTKADPETADECLSKPYQFDHMVAVINRLLDDGAAASPRSSFAGEKSERMRRPVAAS